MIARGVCLLSSLVFLSFASCGAPAPGPDGGTGGGGSASGGGGGSSCSNATAPLPATQVVVDGATYYATLVAPLFASNVSNTQINFGTEQQFRTCTDEPGKNSTFNVRLVFKEKLAASATLNLTNNTPTTTDQVFIANSWFLNTGHARARNNYFSGTTGSQAFTVSGGKLKATLANLELTNQTDTNDKVTISGAIDIDW